MLCTLKNWLMIFFLLELFALMQHSASTSLLEHTFHNWGPPPLVCILLWAFDFVGEEEVVSKRIQQPLASKCGFWSFFCVCVWSVLSAVDDDLCRLILLFYILLLELRWASLWSRVRCAFSCFEFWVGVEAVGWNSLLMGIKSPHGELLVVVMGPMKQLPPTCNSLVFFVAPFPSRSWRRCETSTLVTWSISGVSLYSFFLLSLSLSTLNPKPSLLPYHVNF